MYLVFDVETTGLFNMRAPADDPTQPRIASAAFIYCDELGRETERSKHYVQPDGWTMPQGPGSAGEVNGLTDEYLRAMGTPISAVLDAYEEAVQDDTIICAFNAQFDCKAMRSEFRRAGRDDLFEQTRNVCLMRALRPYQEQGLAMRRGQFVKLAEALSFFGVTNENPHDAMGDAEGAAAILRRLIEDGTMPEGRVHYARTDDGKAAKA